MSNKGIFTALSGAIAQSQKLDTISNNIANTSTTSFKKDKQVFNEYLTAAEKNPDVIQVPKIPASIESFYDMQGGDRGYVDASGTYTDFTQGALKPTGNKFDIGFNGSGFMEVLTPQGVRLSRHGALKIDGQGRSTTKEGFPVLSQGIGQAGEGRIIRIENRNVTISYQVDIFAAGEQVATLSKVDVANKDALKKIGASIYQLKPNYNQELVPAETLEFHQGFLEASNVNIVNEMTDMIATTRAFESTQKAIKAFDVMNSKLVNDVPKAN